MMLRLVTAVALLLTILASCSLPEADDDARTYFESLDLATPESAAREFVDAFDRSDYMTVWLTLDTRAQREWAGNFELLQYRTIMRVNDGMREKMSERFSTLLLGTTDNWYVFDQVMLLAEENDALLIDLEPEGLSDATVDGDTATVVGEFTGIDGDVTIHLTKSPAGRWRSIK